MKLFFPLLFIISFSTMHVFAEADTKVFSIDGKFEAFFPQKPEYITTIGAGKLAHKLYRSDDEKSGITYTAVNHLGTYRYREADIPLALTNLAKGQAIGAKGTFVDSKVQKIGDHQGIVFTIKCELYGEVFYKSSAAIYDGQHFYIWSASAIKKKDSESALKSGLSHFKVL